MDYSVVTFYRYVGLADPVLVREQIREYCQNHNLLGRILLGKEGINGGVSGLKVDIDNFKLWIQSFFPKLTFREQFCEMNSYHKLVVRVRKEILTLGIDADLSKKGKHVSPQEFKSLLDDPNVVVLDARNSYEYKIGRFKNAVEINTGLFSEFPKFAKSLEQFKGKKIAMYCTGGIRCEKSSALLRGMGFDDVVQLEGGIINYVNTLGSDGWQGSLYVFDDRQVSLIGSPSAACELCGKLSSFMINCHNLECDKQFVCCADCQSSMNKTCSDVCKSAPRHRPKK